MPMLDFDVVQLAGLGKLDSQNIIGKHYIQKERKKVRWKQ